MKHYVRGQALEGHDSITGTWRPCVVERDAPYHRAKTGGAYVRWTDALALPPDYDPSYRPSEGGWVPERSLRQRHVGAL